MNDKKWVAAWGNATSIADRKPENYAKNLSLRYPIYMPFNSEKIKIGLSNFCGTEPITVSKVTIAKSDGNRNIYLNTIKKITFNGEESVTIKHGYSLKSDEIDFEIKRGEFLAVTIYFRDFTEMRSGVIITGPLSKGYYSVGDVTESEELPLNTTRNTNCFYFLTDVDALTDANNKSVICYGDSITAQSWPDYLSLRLKDEGINNISVIRRAASGTRILRQYDNITYDSYGLKGDIRFPNEINVSGAETVIIQHGINDIIHPVGTEINPFRPMSDLPTVDELINGIRNYIKIAREKNLKIMVGTLLSILNWRTYADFREELKNDFNKWIRNSDEFDYCIDFDRSLCDLKNDPRSFKFEYDSGDHLHPSEEAYKKMAEIIPINLL